MKNSKFSNTSSAKNWVKKALQDNCQEHDGEPYTNFCSSITCVKPLCPQCIETHYNYHKKLRTQPQIDSFKTLKAKCSRKVWDILEKIGGSDSQASIMELNSVFENNLRKVREAKQNCKNSLDNYFNTLQDHIKKKMSNILSNQSELFTELQKANTIINELKILQTKLQDSRSFLNSVLTITKLDSQKIEGKITQCYNTIKELKQIHKSSLHIQRNYPQIIMSTLSQLVKYSEKNEIKVFEQMHNQKRIGFQRVGSQQLFRKSNDYIKSNKVKNEQFEQNFHQSVKFNFSQKMQKKAIIGMNTFKESASCKYLHFFQNDENILHFLDLERNHNFQEIKLDINFKLPEFHKSIAIPNGDLYFIGGSLPNSTSKSPKIYKYDFVRKTLIYCTSLHYGRSSHSVCFNSKFIYVMGGFLNNQIVTNKCQRYDIINNKVQQIASMNVPVCSFACCSFNGRFIYKFGGITQDNRIAHYIEVYDEKQGQWSFVNPVVDQNGENLLFLSTSAAIQITQSEIMVMGGYDQQNQGHNQTYILKIEPSGYQIKDINVFQLPFAEGFWNNVPVLQNKLVFVLQNVSTSQDECVENLRTILVFDGSYWKSLNIIQ